MSTPRVWLITGANSGLGLHLSLYALSKGDKVIAAARDVSKLPPSLKGAHPFVLNPSASTEEIRSAAGKAPLVYGRIDVLVNNAGYGHLSPLEYLKDEDLRVQFQTNVFGPVTIMQAILPTMRAQKSGHILNVSSIAGFAGNPPFCAYNASKAALDAFTDALSVEVAAFGIRVNTIVPGYFPTSFLSTALSTADTERLAVGAYTLPEQGYGVFQNVHQIHLDQKQVGDVQKAVARIWEFVAGEGLTKGLAPSQGGKREWVRLPLGPDCGARMRAKIGLLKETVDAYEPIWSSTDVDHDKLKNFM
ncbi:hypothetical protein K488DRAFT_91189 [Vararia minispora EC-137]|uniref:Uncharacterized protein n=1 Tax=Vararia minispora EC-137 TaxID=1314806 RepID=A0ACB8Q6G4_9AGAM|nr:hypothetical protein K488DRAFT_91189 [Vararia minispora EC-137]